MANIDTLLVGIIQAILLNSCFLSCCYVFSSVLASHITFSCWYLLRLLFKNQTVFGLPCFCDLDNFDKYWPDAI